MIALLVWIAGCVFGVWLIIHEGYTREAIAFVVLASTLLWIVGGLAWIGRRLQGAGVVRTPGARTGQQLRGVQLSESDREALKKLAREQSPESSG